jgi:hypothetical protein
VKRLPPSPLAFTTDGTLLLNVATELPPSELSRLVRDPTTFVGVPVRTGDVRAVLGRIGHASAEAAARLLGRRRKRKTQRGAKRR